MMSTQTIRCLKKPPNHYSPNTHSHHEYYHILLQDHLNSNRIHSLQLIEPLVSVEPPVLFPNHSSHHPLRSAIPSCSSSTTLSNSRPFKTIDLLSSAARYEKPFIQTSSSSSGITPSQGFSFQTTNTLHYHDGEALAHHSDTHSHSEEHAHVSSLSPKSKFSSTLPYFVQPLKKRNRESYESLSNHHHHGHTTTKSLTPPPQPDVVLNTPLQKQAKQGENQTQSLLGRLSPQIPVEHESSNSEHEDDSTSGSCSTSSHDLNTTCDTTNVEPSTQSSSSFTVQYETPKRKSNRGRKPKARKVNVNEGPWTEEEHEQFLKGFEACGKNWSKIADLYVPSRRRTQIASHAQKWFRKQDKK
ncbi:hypothetical protein FDP41_012647 [Naegleria fowleri]|uniref:Uncharacterized protein n=1 Tax=Naegleria fowleri TaxID=5763 RepID=A0A6A5C6D3_NAEFO|nr:uncharacterized protein FDP41_012647 [Naegleria fowleri]KAF0980859.1 hypothetical protein FDP41_012647 [Naegleria fowleri]